MSDDDPEPSGSDDATAPANDDHAVQPGREDRPAQSSQGEEAGQSGRSDGPAQPSRSGGAGQSGRNDGPAQPSQSGGAGQSGRNDGTAKPGYDEQFCQSCGAIVKEQAEICPECGVRIGGGSAGGPPGGQQPGGQQPGGRQSGGATQKDAGVALLLSGITSGWAGQLYNGQVGKGIAIIALQFVNVLLMVVVVGFLTFPLVWAWGCYDAYSVAKKINRGEIQP